VSMPVAGMFHHVTDPSWGQEAGKDDGACGGFDLR
jgi:hypothetical protein